MANNIFDKFSNWFNRGVTPTTGNVFNRSAFEYIGGKAAQYDYDNKMYIDKGFGMNPDVYAIITQKSKKVSSIPFYVKDISDDKAKAKLDRLNYATKGDYSINQLARKKLLETKAFESDDLDFPLSEPNALQTWSEIFALHQVYMDSIGNSYLYMVWPEDGPNKEVPKEVYVLPAHLVKIVLKKDANLIEDESPIDYYMMIEGNQQMTFPENTIIHIKHPNPFFDFMGSHLYGLSPIRSVLRNIESSNDAIDGNVKMMKNSGVFGFITAKDPNMPFTAEQALQIKERLVEMDKNPARMSKIAGGSAPIEFTKLSLNTNELQPFEYIAHDQKTIANVLGWSTMLLNSDSNMTYNNLQNEKKRVLIDTINPDLVILADALNKKFIPRFKKYEKAEVYFDITECPEMQEDYKAMIEWMNLAPLTPNEIRTALKYETSEVDGMNVIWIPQGKKRIDDADIMLSDLNRSFEDE